MRPSARKKSETADDIRAEGTNGRRRGRGVRAWPIDALVVAVDVVNNGLPLLIAGALVVLGLAALTRDWRLIAASGALVAVNLALAASALQGGAAETAPGSERFLRVVTFNLSGRNDRMDGVAKFLLDSDPDPVVCKRSLASME